MGLVLVFSFVLLLLLFHICFSLQTSNHNLCIQKERVALLEFKTDLVDTARRLVSWSHDQDQDDNDDCCKWTGIVCDNITGHVLEIHLRGPDICTEYCYMPVAILYEEWRMHTLKGTLNPSLLNLNKLEYLDLSSNDFGGIQIPKFIGSFHNLRYLNLSNSGFSGEIPHELGNLSALQVLGLSSKDYSLSASSVQWLSGLSMLQDLDMSNVNLSKASEWLHVINGLPNLINLRLSNCHLPSQYPTRERIRNVNVSKLSFLDVSYNNFQSSFLLRSISVITNLVYLDLSECGLYDLSGDVFRNMTSLKILRVSGNDFVNPQSVFKGLSSIGSGLDSLDVSRCGLSSSVLGDNLQNLTSLVSLDLSFNQLTNGIPKSLGNLCNLQQLDLSWNSFNNIRLLEVLINLIDCNSTILHSLSVSDSYISGHIPENLGKLDGLVHLELKNNLLSGPIPYSIGSLSSLRFLSLGNNSISGPIPYSIGRLSLLEKLYLLDNKLNGSLPQSIGQLRELKIMSFENNMLSGIVTDDNFRNLRKLEELRAGNNVLTLRPSFSDWSPPSQLRYLTMSSWNLGPQFPLWLRSQRKLVYLEMSSTGISDTIPGWFWNIFSNLRYLDVSRNQIRASVSTIPASLNALDLSFNNFIGPLPDVSNNSNLFGLDLSNNSFSGSLDNFLCPKMKRANELYFLNLANNNLSGVVPNCFKNWKRLSFLNLENNNLVGEIPSSLEYLSDLELLNMRKNKFVGRLPISLMNLEKLQILQLSDNNLIGSVPTWLGRQFKGLKILDLRSNKLEGEIAVELCRLALIQVLDLSHNNLSGALPTCFNNFSVMNGKKELEKVITWESFYTRRIVTGVASIVVKEQEYAYSTILGLVTLLDLSSNSFSGRIPEVFMTLIKLRSMNLSGNRLTGRIPEKIGDMKSLETLDLSFNQLSGEIPVGLSDLNFLTRLNFSFNNLTGRIPTGTQIQSFDNSSFIGNRLCGPPLAKDCTEAVSYDNNNGNDMTSNGTDRGFVCSIMIGFIVGFAVVVGPLIVSRLWRATYFHIVGKVLYGMSRVIHKYFG